MASLPPQECCTLAVTQEGEALGKTISIGDNLDAYVTYPKGDKTTKGILLLTDVLGYEFINTRLVADKIASNGYHVVVPDLFHGDALTLEKAQATDVMGWIKGPPGHLPNRVDPVVLASIKYMRETLSIERLGGIGYCFGVGYNRTVSAKYVIRFLGPDHSLFDAGYIAHPSMVDVEELTAIKKPLSIAAAEIDNIFPVSNRHASEEILAKLKIPYQLNLYGGVEHGFATRADIKQPHIRFAQEQAFAQALQWFKQYL
ncbi:hypothetical protein OIDMADRAFT_48844 [Oidiodendron maius Zn]|uniref:Dienelactone hydrolase domain-containing protein n=1 Tax=Oidiodendron maius (strain Zn) TaxID=913774 RepID=A0A0C3E3Q9_OIDMZ|nr:hypothetical protein OIDMADRAFT_48844 [Oidiodendron maius Zn]